MKAKVVSVNVGFDIEKVASCIASLGCGLEIESIYNIAATKFEDFSFPELRDYALGEMPKAESPTLNFLIFHYFDKHTTERVYIERENLNIGINVYGLLDDDYVANDAVICALIYAAFVKYQVNDDQMLHDHGSGHCLFDTGIEKNEIHISLCNSCVEQDVDIGRSLVSAVNSILLWQKHAENQHVFLVHGIETFGEWADSAKKHFDQGGVSSQKIFYGHFPWRYVPLHWLTKKRICEDLINAIKEEQQNNPHKPLSIISHSFGTLITAYALKQHKDIKLNKIILTGSIVPLNYIKFLFDREQVNMVLNECADRDLVVLLAEKFVPGCGASGVKGFKSNSDGKKIFNIRHQGAGHSTVVKTKENHIERWMPFIIEGRVPSLEGEPGPVWYFRWADRLIPKLWSIGGVVQYGMYYFVYVYRDYLNPFRYL